MTPQSGIGPADTQMAQKFEFGLDTFGDVTIGPDGKALTHAEVIRNVIDEGVLADAIGIDAFGVGEHHRSDFSVSAPEVVLATIAGRTKRMCIELYGTKVAPMVRELLAEELSPAV